MSGAGIVCAVLCAVGLLFMAYEVGRTDGKSAAYKVCSAEVDSVRETYQGALELCAGLLVVCSERIEG